MKFIYSDIKAMRKSIENRPDIFESVSFTYLNRMMDNRRRKYDYWRAKSKPPFIFRLPKDSVIGKSWERGGRFNRRIKDDPKAALAHPPDDFIISNYLLLPFWGMNHGRIFNTNPKMFRDGIKFIDVLEYEKARDEFREFLIFNMDVFKST